MNTNVLFSAEDIAKKVQEIAKAINQKYKQEEIIAIGVLKGAFVFYSDLLKQVTAPCVCDFCSISFYGQEIQAKQEVYLSLDISTNLSGKNVLLVDCIADEGNSLNYLISHIEKRNPKSIASTVLLYKPKALKNVSIEFPGFEVNQEAFVVGYGIDYKEEGRHLPYLAQVSDVN